LDGAPAQIGQSGRTGALWETRSTTNVIAETPGGRDDRAVVVGAHPDSVVQGPGIQDNGSGSSTILEIALQMAELGIEPRNKIRFAWWGALVLHGADHSGVSGTGVGDCTCATLLNRCQIAIRSRQAAASS
jgi:hypothetical protein